jgi:hypothetical protein
MTYPDIEAVEAADLVQLAKWFRFLPQAENGVQFQVINRITERFELQGGMTLELSNQIGWEMPE